MRAEGSGSMTVPKKRWDRFIHWGVFEGAAGGAILGFLAFDLARKDRSGVASDLVLIAVFLAAFIFRRKVMRHEAKRVERIRNLPDL